MKNKIYKKPLQTMSNEALIDMTKNCAIDIHFHDGRLTQLCINDLRSFDKESSIFSTRTGIEINLHELDYIKVNNGK